MDNRTAYNQWAKSYDQMKNKTRDLEAEALRSLLGKYNFKSCLEIGCGTGKNTLWLAERAAKVKAVDFSEEMIAKARAKNPPAHVEFVVADVTKAWNFTSAKFDLVSFSLILEHLEDLNHIFREASKVLAPNGLLYLGELHPYKQYKGSKARFETEQGVQVVQCYTHNISDFVESAARHGFHLQTIEEYFDEGNRNEIPRILKLIFKNG